MMIYLLLYLTLCVMCGWIAREKNRSGISWFFIALIFSPLIGLIGLVAVPANPQPQAAPRSVGFYGMNY